MILILHYNYKCFTFYVNLLYFYGDEYILNLPKFNMEQGIIMYRLISKRTIVEGEEYVVYGIRYSDEYCFEDISTNQKAVKELADVCNKLSLSPIHLADVIEDFLN